MKFKRLVCCSWNCIWWNFRYIFNCARYYFICYYERFLRFTYIKKKRKFKNRNRISDFSSPDMKSTYQGLRCFIESLSCIMGPLWGANMLHTRQWMFMPIITFLVISISMTYSSWNRLDARKFKNST